MIAQPTEVLVGRTAEFGSLDHALDELARQRFVGLELVGEPGIGKTRMLAELGRRADRRRHLVLSARAAELERDLPFGMFADALDDYVQALEPRRLDALGTPRLSQRDAYAWRSFSPAPRSDGRAAAGAATA